MTFRAASIIRECSDRGNGVVTPQGKAVWLDTPMIELKNGEGTIEKRIPAMMRMFGKYGIDIRKEPFLSIPPFTIRTAVSTFRPTDRAAWKTSMLPVRAVGGIHGRNRLMGNSLLDVIVFRPQRRSARFEGQERNRRRSHP